MFWLILFIAACIAFLWWLFTPSGQAFAKEVELQSQAREAERLQKTLNSFTTSNQAKQNYGKTLKSKQSNSSAKTFRKTMKNVNWMLGLFDQKAVEKANRRIRNNMGGNPDSLRRNRRKKR